MPALNRIPVYHKHQQKSSKPWCHWAIPHGLEQVPCSQRHLALHWSNENAIWLHVPRAAGGWWRWIWQDPGKPRKPGFVDVSWWLKIYTIDVCSFFFISYLCLEWWTQFDLFFQFQLIFWIVKTWNQPEPYLVESHSRIAWNRCRHGFPPGWWTPWCCYRTIMRMAFDYFLDLFGGWRCRL